MTIEKVEFSIEGETPEPTTAAEDKSSDALEVEVVDDTPEVDRGRKPSPPPDDVTDDELASYDEKVQKRIKKFTKGYHDERRAKEAAQREREEAVRFTQRLLEENERLKGATVKNQEVLLQQATRAAELEMAQAKRSYKEAYEAGDADALVSAQEAMTMARLKAERVANFKPQTLQPAQSSVQPAPQPVQVDERASQWRSQNTWFGSDDEMTAFALGLHQKLVNQGVDPRGDEYYEKINSRMRQVFPDQFDEPEAPKARTKSVVAPATRSTAPKKIVLTQSQVQLAKRLGVPIEIYAKQVAEELRKQNG